MTETLLPTTLVGSLPRPEWLATPEQVRARWLLEGPVLRVGQDDGVLLAIKLQEDVGLDIVTDGEQRRRHYIESFCARLDGFDYRQLVDKPTRGDRYVQKVPTVARPVERTQPILVDGLRFLKAHTTRPVKVTIPGPMTVADTAHDVYYGDERAFVAAIADAINAEARDLAAAGADVVQIDEPAFNIYLDKVEAWGVELLDRCLDGVSARTGVHVCYGYGSAAVLAWKQQNQDWSQYCRLLPLLRQSRVQQLSLEFAASRVDPAVLAEAGDKDILYGCVDVGPAAPDPPAVIADRIRAALRYVPPERLYPCTDCGMAPIPRAAARAKLEALVAAAGQVRAEIA
ncbi:MAG TPA: methionine synthase [Chloroflexota bacterium]|jgi:5-methyltetrahydropteroyltriglutamate--homocysteine methyltransferase